MKVKGELGRSVLKKVCYGVLEKWGGKKKSNRGLFRNTKKKKGQGTGVGQKKSTLDNKVVLSNREKVKKEVC